jgi:predicted component of type VI protein secretion system
VFGRRDLMRYLKSENTKEVSRAHFTIMQEGGAFYLRDGGPDPKNPQVWKPSVNRTSINGTILQPGTKQKLNTNDVIDVSQLGLNLTFKTR